MLTFAARYLNTNQIKTNNEKTFTRIDVPVDEPLCDGRRRADGNHRWGNCR